MKKTALHTYLELADRHLDASALDELMNLFAPDAVVDLFGRPVSGADAIRAFYEKLGRDQPVRRHLWRVESVEERSASAVFGVVYQTADGEIGTAGGREAAAFGPDGRITSLVNTESKV